MLPNFDVIEKYTGSGALSAYTFDFKIADLTQIEIIVLDNTGLQTEDVLGTDTTYLSSVTFDAINGGGTVNLKVALPASYTICLIYCDDAPVQSYTFRDQLSFSLEQFEMALDAIAGPLQRVAWLVKRCIRLDDSVDTLATPFNMEIPISALQTGRAIIVNATGDGFGVGPNATDIANAQANAASAAASAAAVAAGVSQAFISSGPFNITAGQAATDLAAETGDITVITSRFYVAEIFRTGNFVGHQFFSVFNAGGTFVLIFDREVQGGGGAIGTPSGVTFTLRQPAGNLFYLRAAADSTWGDGTVKLKRVDYAI